MNFKAQKTSNDTLTAAEINKKNFMIPEITDGQSHTDFVRLKNRK